MKVMKNKDGYYVGGLNGVCFVSWVKRKKNAFVFKDNYGTWLKLVKSIDDDESIVWENAFIVKLEVVKPG